MEPEKWHCVFDENSKPQVPFICFIGYLIIVILRVSEYFFMAGHFSGFEYLALVSILFNSCYGILNIVTFAWYTAGYRKAVTDLLHIQQGRVGTNWVSMLHVHDRCQAKIFEIIGFNMTHALAITHGSFFFNFVVIIVISHYAMLFLLIGETNYNQRRQVQRWWRTITNLSAMQAPYGCTCDSES